MLRPEPKLCWFLIGCKTWEAERLVPGPGSKYVGDERGEREDITPQEQRKGCEQKRANPERRQQQGSEGPAEGWSEPVL